MTYSAVHDLCIDDREIRVYSNGTGTPVLMLHDLGTSAATFEHLTTPLVRADRELVAIDLPGSGRSDPLPDTDLASYVDHLSLMVEVVLARGDTDLRVTVRDNGVGLPADFSLDETTSLGLSIVRSLVRAQMGGTIDMRTDNGAVVELAIPLDATGEDLENL